MTESNVKPLNTNQPDNFALPELHLLRLRNFTLQQASLDSEIGRLQAEILLLQERKEIIGIRQRAWYIETSKKLNLNLSRYTIDIESGLCEKRQDGD